MSVRVRKLVVVFGFLFSTMVVAGVAGAEPKSGTKARSTTGQGAEATSVSGEQYSAAAGNGAEAGQDGRENKKSRKSRESNRGGKPPNAGSKAPAGSRDAGGKGYADHPDKAGKSGNNKSGKSASEDPLGNAQDSSRKTNVSIQKGNLETKRANQSNKKNNASRQAVRQNNVSRESARKTRVESGRRAVAAARTVQSPEIRRRVKELRKQEKAGELPPAATSYAPVHRRQELRIAREKIVVQPVNEVSLKRYKKLYEKAAEEYGFGDEWYVLAAVGKVESDHGQNMGPSSAGALGPMQFMPSTWDSYGLDANDDGQANIMDPEDAIPSAARYLKAGGAPDDWYEALYTYNHAGWYVEKVLKVAERYRRAAGDNEVGPYYLKDR
jgi:membrane-bound lytic murein transglycosylase B